MKVVKILTLGIWMFFLLYLSKVTGIDKNIYFYLIGFPIALVGIFVIEHLFDKKLNKDTNSF
jgi:hypothetical protein